MIEFEIQGKYSRSFGWECLTTEETLQEAKEQLKCYDENEPEYRHRIKKVLKQNCKASDMDKLMEKDKEAELKKRTGGV